MAKKPKQIKVYISYNQLDRLYNEIDGECETDIELVFDEDSKLVQANFEYTLYIPTETRTLEF